jgi:CDGSH-type Zn-finger protein
MSYAMDGPKRQPVTIDVETGKFYALCRCGKSGRLPLCDGTHTKVGSSPLFYKAEADGRVTLCLCGESAAAPLCDCGAAA